MEGKTCCSSMESPKILCDVCGASFTLNKNLLRHVREKHQGMKRTDNETRKRDVTDNEAGKQGLLAGLYSETFEAQVESVPHAWKDATDKARTQGLLACGSWAACEESVESNPPGSVQLCVNIINVTNHFLG